MKRKTRKGGSLVSLPTFFANYQHKINKIQPPSCWRDIPNLTKNICDMAPFQNGVPSTLTYVEENFPYDPTFMIPEVPEKGCKQVVLGTFELIAPYFYYNKNVSDTFILLAAENWSVELNTKYVSCAFQLLLQNQSCRYPVRLLLPNEPRDLLKTNGTPRVTLFELCIILHQDKRFNVKQVQQKEGQSYGVYLMEHIPGTGGKRTRRNRRRTRRH